MNTFSDWHLVPDTRPVIALPEPKSVTVEVPGGQGILDLSETLTNYPIYGNRSGNLKFRVLNGYGEWQERYQTIANYLHGRKIDIRLEDDPNWVYTGRCKVTWESPSDGTWSNVTIDYNLEPFKRSVTPISTIIPLNSNRTTEIVRVLQDTQSYPIVPTVNISSNTTPGLIFYVINPEIGLNQTKSAMSPISTTGQRKLYSCVLSNMSGSNQCQIGLTRSSSGGSASCTVTYNRVML